MAICLFMTNKKHSYKTFQSYDIRVYNLGQGKFNDEIGDELENSVVKITVSVKGMTASAKMLCVVIKDLGH